MGRFALQGFLAMSGFRARAPVGVHCNSDDVIGLIQLEWSYLTTAEDSERYPR